MADDGPREVSEHRCLNCEAQLAGRWCHACGQDSRDPLRTVPVLLDELLDAFVSWNARIPRTLRLLFSSPGALTAEFVAGRRAQYLGPVRLYLIASVLFFATYSIVFDPVFATISGLGDPQAGMARLDYIARWLPTMMIMILPAFAAVLQVFFRSAQRPFIATLVLTLHFGALAFLCIPVGHLLSFVLEQMDIGLWSRLPTYIAHGVNAVYMWLMVGRFLPEVPVAERALKLLAFSAAMVLLLGGTGSVVAWLLLRSAAG